VNRIFLSKCQVHALESEGGKVASRKLTRAGMFKFFAEVEPCLVGMEACGSAHYWARTLIAMGFDVKPMPPNYVKAYVKRWPRTTRPPRRRSSRERVATGDAFVTVKSAARQAALMRHKTREQLDQTAHDECQRGSRGHLSEFGIVAAKGVERVKELGPRRPKTTWRFPRPPRPA
jgi:transposase